MSSVRRSSSSSRSSCPTSIMGVGDVFTMRVQQLRRPGRRRDHRLGYWFYVLPLGFLLTQYTITASTPRPTLPKRRRARPRRGEGYPRRSSTFGDRWLDPLARLPLRRPGTPQKVTGAGGASPVIFRRSAQQWSARAVYREHRPVLLHQRLWPTSTSRMMFAFSRGRAVPWRASMWAKASTRTRSRQCRAGLHRHCRAHHHPGARPRRHQRRPGPRRLRRAVVSRGGDRPLPRLCDSDLPCAGARAMPSSRALESRHEVEVDGPVGGPGDHRHLRHFILPITPRLALPATPTRRSSSTMPPKGPSVPARRARGSGGTFGEEVVHRPKTTIDLLAGVSADEITSSTTANRPRVTREHQWEAGGLSGRPSPRSGSSASRSRLRPGIA